MLNKHEMALVEFMVTRNPKVLPENFGDSSEISPELLNLFLEESLRHTLNYDSVKIALLRFFKNGDLTRQETLDHILVDSQSARDYQHNLDLFYQLAKDDEELKNTLFRLDPEYFTRKEYLSKEMLHEIATEFLAKGDARIALVYLKKYEIDSVFMEAVLDQEGPLDILFLCAVGSAAVASHANTAERASKFFRTGKKHIYFVTDPADFIADLAYVDENLIASTLVRGTDSSEEFNALLELWKKNKLAAPFVEKLLTVTGTPKEGRPSAEEVEDLKRARNDFRKGSISKDAMKDKEAAALAYSTVLESKKKALKRALDAEEAGTASDPFRVTEIEADLANVHLYLDTQARRAFLTELAEKPE